MNTTVDRDLFQIPARIAGGLALLALVPGVVPTLWALRHLPRFALEPTASYLAQAGVLFLVLRLISSVEVDAQGIRLHRMSRLRWEEITGASVSRKRLLSYLHIEHRGGRVWSVPLVLTDPRALPDSLRRFAPTGHPACSPG